MAVITASPKNFAAMLDMQATANEHLFTMRKLLEASQLTQIAALVEAKRIDDDGDRLEKIEKDTLDVDKKSLEAQEKQLKIMQEDAADRKKRQEDIQKIMESMKVIQTPLEKLKDSLSGFASKFSAENLKKSILQSTNFMGVNNKRLERDRFVKEQRALGAEGSAEDLNKKFEMAFSTRKEAAGVDKQIEKIRADAGGKYSAEEIAKTNKAMADLLKKKSALTEEYAQYDIGSKAKSDKPEAPIPVSNIVPIPKQTNETPTQAFASAGEQQEMQQENARLMGDQTSLLQKIEENTRPSGGGAPAKAAEAGAGGGLLGGIGAGLGALGRGIGRGMEGLLSGVGKGIMKLSVGLATLANPMTLAGLAAATLSIMGIGKALQMAAPAIEAFAPVLMKIADVIGNVFVKAIETIPKVISAIGEVIMGVITTISNSIIGIVDAVTSSIERLAAIDGSALLSVAGGLLALSGAMVAFGGAQAVAGLGNLVGKFLSLGADSPVEQLIKIGQNGEGVVKAAEGMEKISQAMVGFSKIDKKSMEAVNDFPWVRATAFVAAGGAMSAGGSKVYNASKTNADEEAKVAGAGKGGGNTVVSAPTVNNTTRQTNVIRVPVRNSDNSVVSWLRSRYA